MGRNTDDREEFLEKLGADLRETRNSIIAFNARILRSKYACRYCGMSERTFNEKIRPYLRVIEIGRQGIGFERSEVDKVISEYIETHSTQAKRLVRNSKQTHNSNDGEIDKEESLKEFQKAVDRVKKEHSLKH